VSHSSLNCTDISQRLRLQGKYNDLELKNGSMKLTLWTTPELQDIIQNFYVKLIKKIEKPIMGCESWEEIKDLLESIIDNGDFKFGKYMKYIDVSKKRKNLKPIKHYDSKNNGYKLIVIDDMNDTEISEWCKETKLVDYVCINEVKEMKTNKFIEKYGEFKSIIPKKITKTDLDITNKGQMLECIQNIDNKFQKHFIYIPTTANMNRKNGINEAILFNKEYNYGRNKKNECTIINYNDEDYYHIVGLTDDKELPKQSNNYIKNTPYIVNGDNVKYSVIKEEYKQQNTHGYTNEENDDFIEDAIGLPDKYYWKTPDDWLYLYDKDKPEIISLNIVSPLPVKNVIQPNISTEPLINSDILLFANSCCKKTDKTNLRFGLKDIFKIYETWCKINGKKCLKTQKKFKEEFEKINYKEEKSKGVDINSNPGKRGYNIMVSL